MGAALTVKSQARSLKHYTKKQTFHALRYDVIAHFASESVGLNYYKIILSLRQRL